ncbi:hypothetical protein DBY21_09565 [Candidatus Gastranaerophilales bacterium]|nr:MAG: hypothetical protein DBY21_09565 [Candidatus Gastranaerophilales bacterium]
MTDKKCPYCGDIISDTDNVCPKCGENLILKCPFCKEEIKAYEVVCPHCTSKLRGRKEPKSLFYIGYALAAVWGIINLLFLWAAAHFPEIITAKDKDGMLVLPLSSYMQLTLQPMIFISIPYIMAAVKKYKIPLAVICMIINLILGIGFLSYFIHLQYIYL